MIHIPQDIQPTRIQIFMQVKQAYNFCHKNTHQITKKTNKHSVIWNSLKIFFTEEVSYDLAGKNLTGWSDIVSDKK